MTAAPWPGQEAAGWALAYFPSPPAEERVAGGRVRGRRHWYSARILVNSGPILRSLGGWAPGAAGDEKGRTGFAPYRSLPTI